MISRRRSHESFTADDTLHNSWRGSDTADENIEMAGNHSASVSLMSIAVNENQRTSQYRRSRIITELRKLLNMLETRLRGKCQPLSVSKIKTMIDTTLCLV